VTVSADGLVAYVTNPSFSDLSLKEGTEVLAFFKTAAVHVIRAATRDGRTDKA
jgi:molybdopterin-binding protein